MIALVIQWSIQLAVREPADLLQQIFAIKRVA